MSDAPRDAAKMLAEVQGLGLPARLRPGVGPAGRSVALLFGADLPRGFLIWADVGTGWKAADCWVLTAERFVRLGAESLLPFLRGPEAHAEHLRRKGEAAVKAAATRAFNAAFAENEAVHARIDLVLKAGVPVEWVLGGLVVAPGSGATLRKMIAKGEERAAGMDDRDRAGG